MRVSIKTGKEINTAVTKIVQTSNGVLSIEILLGCIFKIVETKLIAPKVEENLAMYSEKTIKSIGWPL